MNLQLMVLPAMQSRTDLFFESLEIGHRRFVEINQLSVEVVDDVNFGRLLCKKQGGPSGKRFVV